MIAPASAPADAHAGSSVLPIAFVCSGCGHRLPDVAAPPLACPMSVPGDDVDHVLSRAIEPAALRFPAGDEPNPFARYRTLLYGYHVARADDRSDAEIVARIEALDRAVAAVDGHGFSITPFATQPRLGRRLRLRDGGALWVKDETGNVSGSHKARHLFGALLELELAGGGADDTALAIASCGNAALAAAVVARAAGRELRVFIPPDAPPTVVKRLEALEVRIEVCPRRPDEAGDPTYRRLLEVVSGGAVPFTCQGNLNASAIEGGMTLGWELVGALVAQHRALDHLVIQVGGGALASAVMQALDEARQLGAIGRLPRIHTVQTRGAHPLARAHERLAAELGPRPDAAAIDDAVAEAARHRSRYMWPWEQEPRSVAHGILDDETYDWLAVVRGMLHSGGLPVVVDEATLRAANRHARETTGIDVDHTGSSGLAGVMELMRDGVIGSTESTAVIFTGVRRESPANGGQP
ncbi:MAG TPA: pyridoxal-phosphate dependent enzyme [Candidatus Limnocylindria bacterium]